MLLSAVSVLVVAQSSSEIPEGLVNNRVYKECGSYRSGFLLGETVLDMENHLFLYNIQKFLLNCSSRHCIWDWCFSLTLCTNRYWTNKAFFLLPALCLASVIHKSQASSSGLYRAYHLNPYPTAFPYGNGMVLHFYQQQESSTTKTVHKVINKGLKTYV